MSKRKVSVEDKIYAVNLYLEGKESQRRIADMFDVSLASVQQWIRNYESMGANAFTLKRNKKYSKELKQQAVLDYLAGYGSQDRWQKQRNTAVSDAEAFPHNDYLPDKELLKLLRQVPYSPWLWHIHLLNSLISITSGDTAFQRRSVFTVFASNPVIGISYGSAITVL